MIVASLSGIYEFVKDHPWECIIGGAVAFFAIIGGASRIVTVTCASCGWRGSKERFTRRGGCPQCGSDLYRTE